MTASEQLVDLDAATIRARFRRQGVVAPLHALSDRHTLYFQRGFDDAERLEGGHLPRASNLHLSLAWAHELATHPEIVAAARCILGGPIGVIGTLVLCKYPGTSAHVPWHQDGVTSGWDPQRTVTAWVALSESLRASGAMRVIPGSHQHAKHEHVFEADANSMMAANHRLAVPTSEASAIDLELRAGQMSLHHVDLIHGSRPNLSAHRRIGFIIRFALPEAAPTGATVVPIEDG